LIEKAYTLGPSLGLGVWCHDQAGPYQAIPQSGSSWAEQGKPALQPAVYVRGGTAKFLTLFHPLTGRVSIEGVDACPNSVLHPWLKKELGSVLTSLPEPAVETTPEEWRIWQEGLSVCFTLPQVLPPLRMLLVLDNLAGHKTPEFVLWLVGQGIMPLYTPLGGSWLNMAESIQRILIRRALSGQHPQTPGEIIDWVEQVASHWNRSPTPFQWGGKRAVRRARSRHRRHALGGSGACTRRPVRRTKLREWLRCKQVTH
jgi:hypothetical protein